MFDRNGHTFPSPFQGEHCVRCGMSAEKAFMSAGSVVPSCKKLEPVVRLSVLCKKSAILMAFISGLSLVMWIAENVFIIAPFPALMILVWCPFQWLMGHMVEKGRY